MLLSDLQQKLDKDTTLRKKKRSNGCQKPENLRSWTVWMMLTGTRLRGYRFRAVADVAVSQSRRGAAGGECVSELSKDMEQLKRDV